MPGHNYAAPSEHVNRWAIQWLHSIQCWRGPKSKRATLAGQLKSIRQHYGTKEASKFRNRLLWIGVYPFKKEN